MARNTSTHMHTMTAGTPANAQRATDWSFITKLPGDTMKCSYVHWPRDQLRCFLALLLIPLPIFVPLYIFVSLIVLAGSSCPFPRVWAAVGTCLLLGSEKDKKNATPIEIATAGRRPLTSRPAHGGRQQRARVITDSAAYEVIGAGSHKATLD